MREQQVDVAIVGSGLVGMLHALLLARRSSLSIALIDSKAPLLNWKPDQYDARVYAITPASQALFEELGLWSELAAKRLSPFKKMSVWESDKGAELLFDQAALRVPALGYIVEENLLRELLFAAVQQEAQIELIMPAALEKLQAVEQGFCLHFAAERAALKAHLLVGADGVNSWVRQQVGIEQQVKAYQHTSLIAQVQTEEPHEQTARQRFLSANTRTPGPLAFLPLQDEHQSSIVWSTEPEQIEALLALPDALFQERLAEAFDYRLGAIQAVSKRQAFPLYERHVDHYVKAQVALMGDAAHSLHPLAGQGLNLGLADAAALAEVVLEALAKGRDYASFATLRRYERARKGHNFMMLQAVKSLKSLFVSEDPLLKVLRTEGLKLTNNLQLLKAFFARYAMQT